MKEDHKTILLVVPEFPPNDSIGGRRWAKFAKYLAKKNYIIKVIAFHPNSEKKSLNWMNDITHPNIQIFYLKSGYPEILQSTSRNLFVRIFKKIFSKVITFYDGGIIQDKAIFFKKTMLSKATELIHEFNIKNVICSGPYHRASYFTTLLKEKFKGLNVIIDFRDRWTDGQVYGIENVPEKVFAKESALQRYTCSNADYVISTYQEILDELKSEYKELTSEKFIHFSHNYDLEDYRINIQKQNSRPDGKIKFIYGGTVNTAAFNDGFKPFLFGLKKLKEENRAIYNLIEFSIYGDNFMLNELVMKLDISDAVTVFSKIQEADFYKRVSESDILLMFLGNKWKDLITTKNITYLPFRKPIVVVSQEGQVSRMISENKLGFSIDPQRCYDNLVNLVHDYRNGRMNLNSDFDYSVYSYENATERLIKLLKD